MNSTLPRLTTIKRENYIWYIYIFISIMAIVSNYFESNFVISKDRKNYNYYHYINIGILIISTLIYLYFIYLNYQAYKAKKNTSNYINLLASILVLIAGLLYLYTTFKTKFEEEIFI